MEQGNALPVGTQLGGYEILAVLGRGGFGITYRVYDPTLANRAKVLALKEYLPVGCALRVADSRVEPTSEADRADYEWGLSRFLYEAQTLARFDHPHINKVHRFFKANGTAYMVLEYVEGEALSAVLRQERFSEAAVLRLLSEVLSGLEEVHRADYVHRDIKPDNLMVQPDGGTVILDFGAARQAVGQRSKRMTGMMTPVYAPVEQYSITGKDVGPWSDLYAVGIVAYRCVSGVGVGDLPDAVSRSLGSAVLEPAASVGRGQYDARLLRAIDWAIEVKREERPQSIAEWRTALPPLEAEAAPTPGPAPRPTAAGGPAADTAGQAPVPTPGRVTISVPRWAPVVGVVALAVVLVGGAYWLGQRGSVVPPEQAAVSPPAGSDQGQAPSPTPQASPPPSASSKPVAAAPSEYPFTIVAAPAGARIRVLNIPERYTPGMGLPAREYAVEVSADGYKTVTETVVHGTTPTERRITLARAGRQPGETFRDCPTCPQMVVVPAGSYRMGSPASEEDQNENEGPVHQVTLGQPFAVGVYEVTRGEYGRFVSTTGYAGERGCRVWTGEKWAEESGRSWRNPGYQQTERDPVVCVSWQDARAYVAWLSRETGQGYRLLSEAEWEYVARAGTATPFHFGRTISPTQANYDGNYTYGGGRRGQYRERTVPVGSFQPNAFGLHDVHGNVWEWVQDCWGSYTGAPSDGRAWESGDCSRRVLRGGSWLNAPRFLRSANRIRNPADLRNYYFGFRIARSLP